MPSSKTYVIDHIVISEPDTDDNRSDESDSSAIINVETVSSDNEKDYVDEIDSKESLSPGETPFVIFAEVACSKKIENSEDISTVENDEECGIRYADTEPIHENDFTKSPDDENVDQAENTSEDMATVPMQILTGYLRGLPICDPTSADTSAQADTPDSSKDTSSLFLDPEPPVSVPVDLTVSITCKANSESSLTNPVVDFSVEGNHDDSGCNISFHSNENEAVNNGGVYFHDQLKGDDKQSDTSFHDCIKRSDDKNLSSPIHNASNITDDITYPNYDDEPIIENFFPDSHETDSVNYAVNLVYQEDEPFLAYHHETQESDSSTPLIKELLLILEEDCFGEFSMPYSLIIASDWDETIYTPSISEDIIENIRSEDRTLRRLLEDLRGTNKCVLDLEERYKNEICFVETNRFKALSLPFLNPYSKNIMNRFYDNERMTLTNRVRESVELYRSQIYFHMKRFAITNFDSSYEFVQDSWRNSLFYYEDSTSSESSFSDYLSFENAIFAVDRLTEISDEILANNALDDDVGETCQVPPKTPIKDDIVTINDECIKTTDKEDVCLIEQPLDNLCSETDSSRELVTTALNLTVSASQNSDILNTIQDSSENSDEKTNSFAEEVKTIIEQPLASIEHSLPEFEKAVSSARQTFFAKENSKLLGEFPVPFIVKDGNPHEQPLLCERDNIYADHAENLCGSELRYSAGPFAYDLTSKESITLPKRSTGEHVPVKYLNRTTEQRSFELKKPSSEYSFTGQKRFDHQNIGTCSKQKVFASQNYPEPNSYRYSNQYSTEEDSFQYLPTESKRLLGEEQFLTGSLSSIYDPTEVTENLSMFRPNEEFFPVLEEVRGNCTITDIINEHKLYTSRIPLETSERREQTRPEPGEVKAAPVKKKTRSAGVLTCLEIPQYALCILSDWWNCNYRFANETEIQTLATLCCIEASQVRKWMAKQVKAAKKPCSRRVRSRPLHPSAICILTEWYVRNEKHPYPNDAEVEALASKGKILPTQVRKWLANRRVRLHNTFARNNNSSLPIKKRKKRTFETDPIDPVTVYSAWFNRDRYQPYSPEEIEMLSNMEVVAYQDIRAWYMLEQGTLEKKNKWLELRNKIELDDAHYIVKPELMPSLEEQMNFIQMYPTPKCFFPFMPQLNCSYFNMNSYSYFPQDQKYFGYY